MKKILYAIILSALCFSCAKEPVPVQNENLSEAATIKLTATFADYSTKTQTTTDNVTTWEAGDLITITDLETSLTYEYEVEESGATAIFAPVDPKKTIPAKGTYNLSAVYAPGVSAEQVNADGFTSASPLSATFQGPAVGGAISLVFSQDASLIEFAFVDAKNSNAPVKVSKVVLASIDNEPLLDAATEITVTPEGNATSSCQIVVSKVKLAKGLLLKVTTAEAVTSTPDGIEFPAGTEFCKVIMAGGADLSASTGIHATAKVLLNQQGISSKADLISFGYCIENGLSLLNYQSGKYTNSGHDSPRYSLLADIDMGATATEPIVWNAIGAYADQDKTFKGFFDGKDHCIYNFHVESDYPIFGLFGDVYDVTYWGGHFENLKLGTRDGATYDGVSKIVYSATGDSDCYVGALCGRVKKNSAGNGNWMIKNVQSFIPIEIKEGASQKVYLGGLTGNAIRVKLDGCANHGDITVNSSKYGNIIGGLVAWAGVTDNYTQAITNCVNTGNIAINQVGTQYVGGIVGRFKPADPEKSNVNSFVSCVNEGDITVENMSASTKIGGIVGSVDVNGTLSVSFSKCSSTGKILAKADVKSSAADLIVEGGIVGKCSAAATFTDCVVAGSVRAYLYGTTATTNSKGGVMLGGILGNNDALDVTITSCTNNAGLEINYQTGDATSPENYCIGGMAGRLSVSEPAGSLVEDCENNGDIECWGNRGTIGGIVGAFADGVVKNCTNNNEIYYRYRKSVKRWIAVGGVVGDAWGDAAIEGCTNKGLVTAKSLTNNEPLGNNIGGIVGWLEEQASCNNCVNEGNVKGNACTNNTVVAPCVGGIIGTKENEKTDKGNINKGNVTALTCATRNALAGGIVGYLKSGTIAECDNYGTVEAGEKASAYDDVNATYTNGRGGSIAGWYKKSDESPYSASTGTITNCGVGGAVKAKHTNGELVTITSENFGGNIVGAGEDPTDCHYAGTGSTLTAVY